MSHQISTRKVLPSGPEDAEILFIGEAPGYDEDTSGIPFDGDAGALFNQCLGLSGYDRSSARVTNTCCYRPSNNKFDYLLGSRELAEGITEIKDYVQANKSRLKYVVLLGDRPLHFIGGKKPHSITKWRSSVFEREGVRYFAMLHPSAVVRDRTLYPIFSFDFERLGRYLREGYAFPRHDYTFDPQGLDLEESLREIESREWVSVDIEGIKGTSKIICCGYGLSNSRAITLVNHNLTVGDPTFFDANARILENPNIKKIFHYGYGYDVEAFRLNGIDIASYEFDTMIGMHIREPEFPKGLDFVTSTYTDEPYYKDKGRSTLPDDDKGWSEKILTEKELLLDYNCTDCIVTYNSGIQMMQEIKQLRLERKYKHQHSLIPVSQELSRNGMEVDEDRNAEIKEIVRRKWKWHQEVLNSIAGFNVNVKSPIHMKKLLLEQFGLPERRNDGAITFDEDAIVSYLGFIKDKLNELRTDRVREKWELQLAACKCILVIRGCRQVISNYINCKKSGDGRIRSIYNLPAATETNRGSSHKFIDGTGLNAQTWPREVLEITEEEYATIKEHLAKEREKKSGQKVA